MESSFRGLGTETRIMGVGVRLVSRKPGNGKQERLASGRDAGLRNRVRSGRWGWVLDLRGRQELCS